MATNNTAVKTANPKNVTIRGRVSFPSWTHKEAVAKALKSSIAQIVTNAQNDPGEIKPEFNLLVEQAQLDKLVDHIKTEFLPYVEEQARKGEKRDALSPRAVKKIQDFLDAGDWTDTPPNMPIKAVPEKTAPDVPEAVASIKVVGPKGGDIELQATVWSEDQLLVPDGDILTYPVRKPLSQTVFQPYAGAYFVATLNLYAYEVSGSVYGISAGANIAFYMGNLEGARLGGGGEVDEEEIFLDD